MNHTCEKNQKLISQIPNANELIKTVTDAEPISVEFSKTVIEFEPTSGDSSKRIINLEPPIDNTEMVADNGEINSLTTPVSKHLTLDIQEDIHIFPMTRRKTNYMWPIIIICLTALIVILGIMVMAVFLLRWARQRTSPRNGITRRHSITRGQRAKHDSTVYQQLYEDLNTPTTPIMLSKVVERSSEQPMFPFPRRETSETPTTPAQPLNKVSYLSSHYHHSNIVPDSV